MQSSSNKLPEDLGETQVNHLSRQANTQVIGMILGPIGTVRKRGDKVELVINDDVQLDQELVEKIEGMNASIINGRDLFDDNRRPHTISGSLTDGAKAAMAHTLRNRSDHQLDLLFESEEVDALLADLD